MTVLEVQRAFASKLADEITFVQKTSELSTGVAERIRKAIDRQREIALNVHAEAVAARDSTVEIAANEILEQWSRVRAMIEGTESPVPRV